MSGGTLASGRGRGLALGFDDAFTSSSSPPLTAPRMSRMLIDEMDSLAWWC